MHIMAQCITRIVRRPSSLWLLAVAENTQPKQTHPKDCLC